MKNQNNENYKERETEEKERRKADSIRMFAENCNNPDFPLCIVPNEYAVKYSFVDGEKW